MLKKYRSQQGLSLIELLVVLCILAILAAMGSSFLGFTHGKKLRVQTSAEAMISNEEIARSNADNGLVDESTRTFDPATVVLSDSVQIGGSEYDNDLPANAPRITKPVVFEPQSGRAKDKNYGFIILKSGPEQEERAIFVPYLPGPTVLYIRHTGEKSWHRMKTSLY